MLLLGICQNILQRTNIEALSSDLLAVQENCKMLVSVSESSASGLSFLQLLEPLYLQTKEVVEVVSGMTGMQGGDPMRINSIIYGSPSFDSLVLVVLMGELIDALNIHSITGLE
jgi:hypothetical protein